MTTISKNSSHSYYRTQTAKYRVTEPYYMRCPNLTEPRYIDIISSNFR